MWAYAENLDWSEADTSRASINAAFGAVRDLTKYESASQHFILAMHVQLKEGTVEAVTSPLLTERTLRLLDGAVKFYGINLVRDNASIEIEPSAGYANALFVRIVRQHPAGVSMKEIAETLYKDEVTLFETLGMEGAL
jgi:hypothetical protein